MSYTLEIFINSRSFDIRRRIFWEFVIWKFESFDRSIYPKARIHTKVQFIHMCSGQVDSVVFYWKQLKVNGQEAWSVHFGSPPKFISEGPSIGPSTLNLAYFYLECCRSSSTSFSSLKAHWPPITEARSKIVTSAVSPMAPEVKIPHGPAPITATFGLPIISEIILNGKKCSYSSAFFAKSMRSLNIKTARSWSF